MDKELSTANKMKLNILDRGYKENVMVKEFQKKMEIYMKEILKTIKQMVKEK